jgi:hypothetical protein
MAASEASPAKPALRVDSGLVPGDRNGEAEEFPAPRPSPTVAFDKALDNILKLGTHDLTLEHQALLVADRSGKKKKNMTSEGPTRPLRCYIVLTRAAGSAVDRIHSLDSLLQYSLGLVVRRRRNAYYRLCRDSLQG